MKAHEVDKALHQKFVTEDHRLVFWHDTAGEFADYVTSPLPDELSDVHVLDLAHVGGLSAKLRLEIEDPAGKYLVYRRGPAAPAEEDWLLDIRLYSAQFHADVASIWLQELGLTGLYLRDHLKARSVFLGSQDRRRKLSRLVAPGDDEAAIDLKMMAVLAGSQLADPFAVLRTLCHGHFQDGHFALETEPETLESFGKMALDEPFWTLMAREFGYRADPPTLAGLLRRLLVSELLQQLDGARISALTQFDLPTDGCRNAVVFLTQWRDSSGMANSYDAAADAVADELKIGALLADLPLSNLKDVQTFWDAEQRVLSLLKARVLEDTQAVDVAAITALARDRQAGHWLGGPGSDAPERRAMREAYDAVGAAAELFALQAAHRLERTFETPAALLGEYRERLYRFDRQVRHFWTKARPAMALGWDLLKTLADAVERTYDQGFLQPLGVEWSRMLDEGFLATWSVDGLPAEQNFYADQIEPHLRAADRRRAFVIISDAFRYEAATELTEELNGRYRMNAELGAMLGVLPSYTALGMASLLPHRTIGFDDAGHVLVDDKPSSGTDARNKQLGTVKGMACQAKDLLVLKVDEARAFTEGHRVVYIYHNVIDSRGDSASTEGETFEAVADCIRELLELVQFCVNRLNAAKVWITADHGFLFQHVAPSATDKSALSYKPDHAVIAKKRYVLGRALGTVPQAHHGSTAVTAGTADGMEFWVPRGTNRFHFVGGARYVHGGAMPQEVLVPVVTVTQLRGKEQERSRIEKVGVQVLGTRHRITTPVYRFELIQTEAVADRRKALTVRAAVYEDDQPVTSIETVTFDSASDSLAERQKSVRLELRTGSFDKAAAYRLILHDTETDAEVLAVDVVIDRSFERDF
ncbi:MAG: BREX-1 system phosphatase PglZ type A [Ardenticatenales bacterium]